MIVEKNITTIDQLIQSLNGLPNHYIFRGHADSSWKLESTMERVIGAKWSGEYAKKFEEYSWNTFRSKYHIYNQLEHIPESKLSWLSVMQHYGVPTRLLDFTESPYVALYFALEAYNPLTKLDFAIYAIDYKKIMDYSISYIHEFDKDFEYNKSKVQDKKDQIFDIVDQKSYDILWVTEPLKLNARIDRQAGTFLISGNREKTIESIISNGLYKECIIKFVIKNHLYENVYALLRKMNINSKSIYGDLSGLAKAIKMELQVYSI